MPERRSWINVVSRDHVEAGVAGGFTQADHGKDNRLRRLRRGDRIAFYSAWTKMRSGQPLQQLTALGTVTGDEPSQVELTPHLRPWRLPVAFESVTPVDIHLLLPRLSFVTDLEHWGLAFRRGLFEVPASDMDLIAAALRAT